MREPPQPWIRNPLPPARRDSEARSILVADGKLDFKQLEKDRGYLVHVATTYKHMIPFMKGIHLTIDSWRPNRFANGWKMSHKEWSLFLSSIKDEDERDRILSLHSHGHPDKVAAANRLKDDLTALRKLFDFDSPVKVSVRFRHCIQAILGIGDAAKTGFGDSFLSVEGINYTFGVWNTQTSQESSNYREFRNFLDSVRKQGEAGRLTNSMLVFATDNSTVEQAVYKGSSDSPLLLDMVIEYFELQVIFNFTILITHIAGKRMIACGSDGLSRGATNEGIMNGEDFLSFLPLHLSAID